MSVKQHADLLLLLVYGALMLVNLTPRWLLTIRLWREFGELYIRYMGCV